MKFGLIFILCGSLLCPTYCWDLEELEIFDVVEEVNENFYTVMGVSQGASLSDIKKAYRSLSKQIHPDKSDAADAEIKFRQLVSIYDILRDERRRLIYNRVLVEGLPDWKSPIYYYRRARKMSLLEISIILTIVISITQYLMAWGAYVDKRHTMEEFLLKKYKIKDKRKLKPEDEANLILFDNEMKSIPRPSIVHSSIVAAKEDKKRRDDERKQWEEEEIRIKEEEEKRKERRLMMKSKKEVNLPDYSGSCILDTAEHDDSLSTRPIRPVEYQEPVITGGMWTEEDFSELARLMAKYPGGTAERWEKIARQMGRTVYEVTTMSDKLKSGLLNRNLISESEVVAVERKVKQKTRGSNLSQTFDDRMDTDIERYEHWSPMQQKVLEKALKQFPKGTDQRWDKIANSVPEKSKEECIMRFKYLAERIRRRREDDEATADQCPDHMDSSEPMAIS